MTSQLSQFERYLDHLTPALKHRDREAGLRGYCAGLLAPLARKSVEPMAAHLDPRNTRSLHESLHHFVADSAWSDALLLARVAQWVVPKMDFSAGGWWFVGDTSLSRHGSHMVGVARQYCKTQRRLDTCQLAVSVSLTGQRASLPLAWRLYLPPAWAEDAARRGKAGVPESIAYASRPAIALALLERLIEAGAPRHAVLADAEYFNDAGFRRGLNALNLECLAIGQSAATTDPQRRSDLDLQALKQDFGLDHYEGRGWRGLHHHASLCIAAYGFVLAQRLAQSHRTQPAAATELRGGPRDTALGLTHYRPRGSPAHAALRPLAGHALVGAYRREAASASKAAAGAARVARAAARHDPAEST